MTDLVAHFLENYETSDPLLKLQMTAEAGKLRASDTKLPPADRQKALRDVTEAYRQLIAKADPGHWKLPIWRTDFVQYATFTVLRGDVYFSAADFVEFGTPRADQEKLFAELAPEAAIVMEQAANEMFFLQGDLPRRADFGPEFEDNGRWDMLVKEYGDLSLPFFKALAWHYASLGPKPPEVVNLEAADTELSNLIARDKLSGAGSARTHILQARVRLRMGKAEEAIKSLDAASAIQDADPADQVIAQLTRSQALAKLGKKDEALGVLDELASGERAAGSPILLILIFDARFRVTQDPGEYTKLLAHPAAAKSKNAIQQYVNRRIVEKNPVAADGGEMKIEGKTALEVLAQADALLQKGQRGGEDKAKSLTSAAGLLDALIQRGGLQPTDEAKARFNLGIAYRLLEKNLEAIQAWGELANKLPDQPEAQPAAINAFKVAAALLKKLPDNKQIETLYEASIVTILTRYPHAELAAGQPVSLLWYTLGGFHRERKAHAKALEAYSKVAVDHPYFADAAYEALVSRFELWGAGVGDEKKKLGELFVAAADRAVATLAEARGQAADDKRRDKLLSFEGDTTLMRSEVAAESLGQGGAVKVALANFETKYGKFEDLVARKRQLMVNILLAMGQVQEAKAEVDKFKAANPDQAGPLVNGVLETLHRQIDDRQKVNPNDPQIASLRQSALEMAGDLRQWAATQPDIKSDKAKMLYFDDLYGRELVVNGKADEAIVLYEGLTKLDFGGGRTGGDQVEVLLGLGKAYAGAGQHEKAAGPLKKIIAKGEQLSPGWWEAWLLYVKALDAQYDEADAKQPGASKSLRERNIFLAVGQLEHNHPTLGGPQLKPEFLRLRNKNAPK